MNQNLIQKTPEKQTQLLLMLLALLVSLISILLRPVFTTTAVFVMVVAILGAGVILIQANWLIPIIPAVTITLNSYFLMLIYRYIIIDKQRNRTRHLFSLYLQPKLVDQMVKSEKLPELGGESREITAWFADLKNFTASLKGCGLTGACASAMSVPLFAKMSA